MKNQTFREGKEPKRPIFTKTPVVFKGGNGGVFLRRFAARTQPFNHDFGRGDGLNPFCPLSFMLFFFRMLLLKDGLEGGSYLKGVLSWIHLKLNS